jgi:hypothetical protein
MPFHPANHIFVRRHPLQVLSHKCAAAFINILPFQLAIHEHASCSFTSSYKMLHVAL